MTKSGLIELIARNQNQLTQKDIEFAVNQIIDSMTESLAVGDRIEIRGFGSFSLNERAARKGRNPKTGEAVSLEAKKVPHFKPGKQLRDLVDESRNSTEIKC